MFPAFSNHTEASGYKSMFEMQYENLSDEIGVERFVENFNEYSDIIDYKIQITTLDCIGVENNTSVWKMDTNLKGFWMVAESGADGYLGKIYLCLDKSRFYERQAGEILTSILVVVFGGFASHRDADILAQSLMLDWPHIYEKETYYDKINKRIFLTSVYVDPDIECFMLSSKTLRASQ